LVFVKSNTDNYYTNLTVFLTLPRKLRRFNDNLTLAFHDQVQEVWVE